MPLQVCVASSARAVKELTEGNEDDDWNVCALRQADSKAERDLLPQVPRLESDGPLAARDGRRRR
jgi:hypothetical protein